MITRRQLLALSTAAAAVALDAARGFASAAPVQAPSPAPAGPFTLPPLPYPADALEPHIDAQTMTIHHDRHHAAYVTNLNAAVASHNRRVTANAFRVGIRERIISAPVGAAEGYCGLCGTGAAGASCDISFSTAASCAFALSACGPDGVYFRKFRKWSAASV